MKRAPTSGRKVTRESSGQVLIAGPPSPHCPEHVPGDQQNDADHHGKGIVIEISALQPDGALRKIARDVRYAVRSQAVNDGAISRLPETAANEDGRPHEEDIVEFVEVPLVVGEEIERSQTGSQQRWQRRNLDVEEPGEPQ